jgi:hypothetical protein
MAQGFEAFDEVRLPISELCYMGDGKLARSTGKQRAYIHGLLDKANMDEDDLLLEMGIDVPMSDFTIEEAGEAIEILKPMQKRDNWSRGGW